MTSERRTGHDETLATSGAAGGSHRRRRGRSGPAKGGQAAAGQSLAERVQPGNPVPIMWMSRAGGTRRGRRNAVEMAFLGWFVKNYEHLLSFGVYWRDQPPGFALESPQFSKTDNEGYQP